MTITRATGLLGALLLASALTLTGCGDDSDPGDESGTEESSQGTSDEESDIEAGEFCDNVNAAWVSIGEFGEAFVASDIDGVIAWAESFPDIGQAVIDSAPDDELKADAELAIGAMLDVAETLRTANPTDAEALEEIITQIPQDEAIDESGERLLDECGIDPDSTPGGESEEGEETETETDADPVDCKTIDPAPATEALGLPESENEHHSGSSVDIGVKYDSCNYGSSTQPAFSIATMAFTDTASAAEQVTEITESNDGELLTPDLGSLPERTLVTAYGEIKSISVYVFDAATPFSVTVYGDDLDETDAVAAAEAIYAEVG